MAAVTAHPFPTFGSSPLVADVNVVLERVRARHPLVHCLTNQVVKNFTANALLAVGAAPAMVEHPDEAAEFAAIASALLVNVGTLDEAQKAAITRAVPAATAARRPWVLDPVAVGALTLRTQFCRELLSHRPTLIRGNASEIIALAGLAGRGRGVDSGDPSESAIAAAKALAKHTGGAVLVTGVVDYVTDGAVVRSCANGHVLLTRVTGVGCAQGALAAACVAVADSPLQAGLAVAAIVGIAGEIAAARCSRPGGFQIALLDALDEVDSTLLREHARLL